MFEADQRRLFSQFEVREFCDNLVEDFEEKPFDYPHQEPLLGTKRPMDVDLYPIFDEENDHLDELGPIVDEEAPNLTSINMENHLCFDPGTTPTMPLSTDIQKHCEKLDLINSLPEMFVKISSQDVKSFGFDKERENDAPWIVDPGQDGAQLDPTEVSPSDDATMVEPEANLEKKGLREWMQPCGCISVDATPMEGTKWEQQSIDLEDIMELDTHEHFGRVRRSDTYLGELVELNQSDTYISELEELSELSDFSLELNELSDTEDGAGLVSGRNGSFQPKEKFITNSIWVGFTPNSTGPFLSPF
uniref:Uncharacterized protein n=1 Tax=Brassica campestris TaxID=3711 RepID=M4FD15_BRACM